MLALIIYNAGIRLYRAGVAIAAAAGNNKARRWLQGRKNWRQQLQRVGGDGPLVWVHAASLGEFEQGRPVLESLRQQHPGCRILLTFFSPSGYEVRKDYKGADYVYYLPLDTRRNAEDFLALARPQLAIFIKYEFWHHFLTALYRRGVPVLLISGIFRPGQVFFRPWGGMFRRLLQGFTRIFVQDAASLQLLQQAGIRQAAVAGDTRFDRVWALRREAVELPQIAAFTAGRAVVVAGSTWEADERLLAEWWRQCPQAGRCLVIAPHEIDEAHIARLEALFPGALRYAALGAAAAPPQAAVLIVNTIGILSALYRYGRVTYVGGGFGKDGIHNVLEPATYGRPVLFGPVFHKYPEAAGLLAAGGGASVANGAALAQQLEQWLADDAACTHAGRQAEHYVAAHQGATGKILQYINGQGWLEG